MPAVKPKGDAPVAVPWSALRRCPLAPRRGSLLACRRSARPQHLVCLRRSQTRKNSGSLDSNSPPDLKFQIHHFNRSHPPYLAGYGDDAEDPLANVSATLSCEPRRPLRAVPACREAGAAVLHGLGRPSRNNGRSELSRPGERPHNSSGERGHALPGGHKDPYFRQGKGTRTGSERGVPKI